MKESELRQSILQAAVQGKLVTQNPHDEPASKLLERIRVEKVNLVKEGKDKKEMPLPPITVDEIPYDLPDGWEWEHISEVTSFQEGPGILAVDFRSEGIPLIRIAGMQTDIVTLDGCNYLDPEMVKKRWSHFLLDDGDIIISTSASLDKIALVNHIAKGAIPYTGLIRFKMSSVLNREYFRLFIKSSVYIQQIMEQMAGGMIKHYGPSHLKKMLIPIPPFSEQKRISAKVNELMALCDELEAAEKELDKLEADFVEYLPKAILQSALHGKLVLQSAHDEPASELLKRIQQEKTRLIKEGKLKKEKPLPPVAEDEVPYDLPEGWVWCRLGDIVLNNIGGGTPSKQNPEFWGGSIPWASVKDLTSNLLTSTQDTITEAGLEESSSNLIPAETIIVCTRMGLGKIALSKIPVAINQDLRALSISASVDKWYFINYYRAQVIKGDGMTVMGISIGELHAMLFPLPPLVEQQRIIAKVDELMVLCDELKAARDVALAIAPTASSIVPFPVQEEEDELLMVARGEVSGKQSKELKQAQADLFGDDMDE